MSTDNASAVTAPADRARARPAKVVMRRPIAANMIERPPGCPFDPAPGLQERRGGPPVSRLELLNGATSYLVTGMAEARAVLTDARFSSDRVRNRDATSFSPEEVAAMGSVAENGGCPVVPAAEAPPRRDGFFIFMDPPEHTRMRRLLTGQFTVRRMQALESRVHEIAVEHIEAMQAAGTEADLVSAYALPIPSLMICELLGVDYADRAEFQDRTAVALNLAASEADQLAAQRAQHEFMLRLVASKRVEPTDDLLSGLTHADPPLTDKQLVQIALVLLGAGHETTANMLSLGVLALLQNPDQLAALRADPGLIDGTVEELLRYLSIVQLSPLRIATEPVTLGGVDLPAGATVLLATPEVNRDPAVFADPDHLDVRRGRVPHLAFGYGVHQCLGQQLARIELRIGLMELITRLPDLRLAVPVEEVPVRNEMLIYGLHALPVAWG